MTQDNTKITDPGKEKEPSAEGTKNTAHKHTDIETVTPENTEDEGSTEGKDGSAGAVEKDSPLRDADDGADTEKAAGAAEKKEWSDDTMKKNTAHEHTDIETVTSDNENIRPVPDQEEQERKKKGAG